MYKYINVLLVIVLILVQTNSLMYNENNTEVRYLTEKDKETDLGNDTKRTENNCLGDEEYCNLTRQDYEEMLYEYIYPHTYEWVLIGTHTVVFVMGLVGNALVCVAVYRNHTMRTVTNYFIVNLAVADFMVILFCLPPTVVWDVTETWFLGDALCKILLYFQSVSVSVSVLTLTFISVDRWYAICFPLKFKSTTGRAKTAILIIWLLSLLFNAPELVVLTALKPVPLRFDLELLMQCMPTWSANSDLVWHLMKVVFIYTIPLMLMTVAYYQIVKVLWKSDKIPGQAETIKLAPAEQTQLRSRRKAAKMLVAVVVMFAVCYFPVHLLSVLRYTVDMEQTDVLSTVALISHVMCYSNSAINPLIYNFMSGKFRREFRRSFCCSRIPSQDNFTTLTRVTTSKGKRCEFVTFQSSNHPYYRNVCSTTFIDNRYKNGHNGYVT
ncbi:orexin receptor type 2-like [Plodia interpunctella]|uniref:orexin receptor type 2-like n=1 Tax=Plodia interpunctella TaxID=58824 RepID=UPI002367A3DE|nr:orexin receptor type 2-like [Plodia interpunctella]